MKFRIGQYHELLAESKELQPAFYKGAMAAHNGQEENNPYQRKSYRDAWELGYHGVKNGAVIVEVEKMECPRCGSSVIFPASNPRYRHTCHICDFKWRDEKNPKPK